MQMSDQGKPYQTSTTQGYGAGSTPDFHNLHGPQTMPSPQMQHRSQHCSQSDQKQGTMYKSTIDLGSLKDMVYRSPATTRRQMNISPVRSTQTKSRPLLPKPSNTAPQLPVAVSTPKDPDAESFTGAYQRQSYSNNALLETTYVDFQHQTPLPEETPPVAQREATSSNPFTYQSPPLTINPQQSSMSRWQQAYTYRMQVHEPPQVGPLTDDTIAQVSQNAEKWVNELIRAITNTTSVKDTPTSHALRMFLPNAYDPLLIEATARQIFICLLDRCTHGFRGPASFNKALKPARDLENDSLATCEERIGNVVEVLSWNKRVCKDVLYEDWKVRLLVNHPLHYDKEKDCQKGSNDQRKKRLIEERQKLRSVEEELKAVRGIVEGVNVGRKRTRTDYGLIALGDA